jgi:hypothetical protein
LVKQITTAYQFLKRNITVKKLLLLNPLFLLALLYSFSPYASAEGHHGRGHHKHHHSDQDEYYQERPRYQAYQDPRSHQGLAGGVVGSVLGYELGNGNPIATGVGAAAGSYLGNGMAGRR